MTIRTIARLANASTQQTSVVVGELVRLGVASRREAGVSALVALNRVNKAARLIVSLADLWHGVIEQLRDSAARIKTNHRPRLSSGRLHEATQAQKAIIVVPRRMSEQRTVRRQRRSTRLVRERAPHDRL